MTNCLVSFKKAPGLSIRPLEVNSCIKSFIVIAALGEHHMISMIPKVFVCARSLPGSIWKAYCL